MAKKKNNESESLAIGFLMARYVRQMGFVAPGCFRGQSLRKRLFDKAQ